MILIKKLVPFFVFAACMINASAEDNNNSADVQPAVALQEHVVATESTVETKVADNSALLNAAQQPEYVVNISCKDEKNTYGELVLIVTVVATFIAGPTLMAMYLQYEEQSKPEWQLRNLEEQQKLAYEQAKQAFQKALWKSDAASEKCAYNCPIESQDAARQFVECGGRYEMKEIVNRFYASM